MTDNDEALYVYRRERRAGAPHWQALDTAAASVDVNGTALPLVSAAVSAKLKLAGIFFRGMIHNATRRAAAS